MATEGSSQLDNKDEIDLEVNALHSDIYDVRTALNLFFLNRFDEAEDILKTKADRSLYHAEGRAVLLFLKAMLAFEKDLIKLAQKEIENFLALTNSCRRQRGITQTLSTIFHRTAGDYSDLEAHSELCHSEALLLLAILNIVGEEDLASWVKGSLKFRSGFAGYRVCESILLYKSWTHQELRSHFEGGVLFGTGILSLVISLLPPNIISLLHFVGYPGNEKKGLDNILKSISIDHLRRPLGHLAYLAYNLLIKPVLGGRGNLDMCRRFVEEFGELYPEGAFTYFFQGRYSLLKSSIKDAVVLYSDSIKSQNSWPQLKHINYWELYWINGVLLNWPMSVKYATLLFDENGWSRSTYAYMRAAATLETYDKLQQKELKSCNDLMEEVQMNLKRFAGKSVPLEKFALRRSERYFNQNNWLLLPALEFICLASGLDVAFAQHTELADAVLKHINAADRYIMSARNTNNKYATENSVLVLYLRACCLRSSHRATSAIPYLQHITLLKNELKEDLHLIPYAIVEEAYCYRDLGKLQKATELLHDARKNYKSYLLESRLQFKIQEALSTIGK